MRSEHDPTPDPTAPRPPEITSVGVLGARLMWVIVGPLVLLAITYGIVIRGSGWMTALDAAFGLVVILMLLGRWVEQRSGQATNLSGEPARPEQFRRYVLILPMFAVAVWVIANALGNHILA